MSSASSIGWAAFLAAGISVAAERPNLLVIITDQQHAGMMSGTGNRYLETPAMDGLAAGGVRFERAYVANPVCVPSRVSMFTGHMPSAFGMRSNAEARDDVPARIPPQSMGWLLRRAGYETAYGGKTHWMRGMTPASLGFENLTSDQRDGLAEACVGFLKKPREKPFLLVASFINPHDICYMAIDAHSAGAKTAKAYPQSTVERKCLAQALELPAGVSRAEFFERLCPPLPANYAIPALEPECIRENYLGERSFRRYVRDRWTDADWRLHRWAYCRLTEMVDAQIGRVLAALRQNGLADKTVVVFTSDHGDLDAAHRLEHKSILYEEAVRVPLIISGRGVARPGRTDEQHLISTGLDLLPTLCDYAGAKPPAGLHGRSLRGLAEGKPPEAWRAAVVVESSHGRMLRTARFKYNIYQSGAHREQLIDLERDPGEMHNLAEDAQGRDVLAEHRRLLRAWVAETDDQIGKAYQAVQQGPSDKTYRVHYQPTFAMTIDGRADEAAWSQATVEKDFAFPWKHAPAPATEFRALCDDANLYFTFRVTDADIVVLERLRDKEDGVFEDRAELYFSRDDQMRDYYAIEVDSRGRAYDYRGSYYRRLDPSWKLPDLETKGAAFPGGYVVEGRIPLASFESLGFPRLRPGGKLLCGLFRAEFSHDPHARVPTAADSVHSGGRLPPGPPPLQEWISWVHPQTKDPDFHVPSSLGWLEIVR